MFREARRRGVVGGCTWHVYAAAALLELRANKDEEASVNVFEAGMREFGGEPLYLLRYADLLSRLNDDTNLRVLFGKFSYFICIDLPSSHQNNTKQENA